MSILYLWPPQKGLVSNSFIHIVPIKMQLHVPLCIYNAPINVFPFKGEGQASPQDLTAFPMFWKDYVKILHGDHPLIEKTLIGT